MTITCILDRAVRPEVAGSGTTPNPAAAVAAARDLPARPGLGARLWASLVGRRGPDHERGDVPGWVLVTLMTAGLVITLWAVAGPGLAKVFDDSIKSVQGPSVP